jgi:hypothetical protein
MCNTAVKIILVTDMYCYVIDCRKCPEDSEIRKQAVDVLVPLTLDACTEHLHDTVLRTLERVIGDSDTDEHQKRVFFIVLEHTYYLLRSFTAQSTTQYMWVQFFGTQHTVCSIYCIVVVMIVVLYILRILGIVIKYVSYAMTVKWTALIALHLTHLFYLSTVNSRYFVFEGNGENERNMCENEKS